MKRRPLQCQHALQRRNERVVEDTCYDCLSRSGTPGTNGNTVEAVVGCGHLPTIANTPRLHT